MLILDNDGEVWSLGCAETGQLGRVSPQKQFQKFIAENQITKLMIRFSCLNSSVQKGVVVELERC